MSGRSKTRKRAFAGCSGARRDDHRFRRGAAGPARASLCALAPLFAWNGKRTLTLDAGTLSLTCAAPPGDPPASAELELLIDLAELAVADGCSTLDFDGEGIHLTTGHNVSDPAVARNFVAMLNRLRLTRVEVVVREPRGTLVSDFPWLLWTDVRYDKEGKARRCQELRLQLCDRLYGLAQVQNALLQHGKDARELGGVPKEFAWLIMGAFGL